MFTYGFGASGWPGARPFGRTFLGVIAVRGGAVGAAKICFITYIFYYFFVLNLGSLARYLYYY